MKKCKHEGAKLRYVSVGTMKNGTSGNRVASKKQVPILYCPKCFADIFIKIVKVES